jgi:hypothetical protein
VVDDEYGAPAAPPVSTAAVAPATDEYGAPAAAPAAVVPAGPAPQVDADAYGAPEAVAAVTTDNSEGFPQVEIIDIANVRAAAPDTYGAPANKRSTNYASGPNPGDSYGSLNAPAPSSYDAPAVPAGFAF